MRKRVRRHSAITAITKTAFQEAKTRFYMKKRLAQITALSRSMHIFGYSKSRFMHIFGRCAFWHNEIGTALLFKNCVGVAKEKGFESCLSKPDGRSDRIRTCGIDVPNAKMPIFSLLYKAFRSFCVRNQCFRVLFQALFPRSPKL